MTVETEVTRVIVLGDGVTTTFSYTFPIPGSTATDQTNAELILTDTSSVSTTLADNLWSITGVDTGVGGTFTYPLVGSPVTTGSTLTLVRIVPFEQTTSLSAQGAYSPAVVEAALDNIVEQTEQLNVRELQNLRAPITEAALNDMPAAALRANAFLAFNSTGQPITVGNTSGAVGTGIELAVAGHTISTGTALFSNLNGVSWGFNGQTITGSVATSYRASNDALGLNTAGSNITWTANSSGVSIDARGYAGTGFSGTNISGTHNSLGIQLSVAAPGAGGGITASSYQNLPMGAWGVSGSLKQGNGSYSEGVAFNLPYAISASYVRLPILMTNGSTTIGTTGASLNASANITTTWQLAFYSYGAGASSQSLMSVTNGSCTWVFQNSVSVAANGTQGSYSQALTYYIEGNSSALSTQYSVSDTNYPFSSTAFANFTGPKFLDIPFAASLSAGAYWMLVGMSTGSATNSTGIAPASNATIAYSRHYVSSGINSEFNQMGISLGGGGNGTGPVFGAGSLTSTGTIVAFANSQITGGANNEMVIFQLLRSA